MPAGPYKMGTIARLSGFSPDLLRAWEKRHHLLSPVRGPGGQRLYTDADLATLRRIKAGLDEGRSISEVVAATRSADARRALPSPTSPRTPPTDTPLAAWRAAILDAAIAMDSAAISARLDESFATIGATRTVHEVIQPCARAIGDAWQAGTCSVASEHLASDLFTHRVRRLLDEAQPLSPAAPRLVAGCFPGEDHQLGLLMLSWNLARRGCRVDYLGPSVPMSNLEGACRAASARGLLLSVTRPSTYRRHRQALSRLLHARHFPWPVIVGGGGIAGPNARMASGRAHIVQGDVSTDLESTILNLLH